MTAPRRQSRRLHARGHGARRRRDRSRSASLAPPEHCPSRGERATRPPTTPCSGSSATSTPTARWLYEYDAGPTRWPPTTTTSSATPAAMMGLYQAATAGIPAPWRAPTVARRGPRTTSSSTTGGPRCRPTAGRRSGGRRSRRRARRAPAADRRHARRRAAARPRALPRQPDRPTARSSPSTTRRTCARRSRAARSTTPARRTGRWPGCTGCSPTRGSARSPIASATTWRRERDEVEGHWPPIPDHWVAYGLAETVTVPRARSDRPLTAAELAYARRQAGLFGSQVRWVSQQAGPWGSLVRGTTVPRGGGYGVVGEALTGLWRVAEADDRLDDARQPIGRAGRVHRRAGHRSPGLGRPRGRRAGTRSPHGAWFIDGVTRMDDQQHATRRCCARRPSSRRAEQPRPRRAVDVAVGRRPVATLNPLFVALGVPRRDRRSERATTGGRRRGDRRRRSSCSPPRCRGRCSTRSTSAGRRRGWRSASSAPWPGSSAWPAGHRREPATGGLGGALVPVAVPLVATPALIAPRARRRRRPRRRVRRRLPRPRRRPAGRGVAGPPSTARGPRRCAGLSGSSPSPRS